MRGGESMESLDALKNAYLKAVDAYADLVEASDKEPDSIKKFALTSLAEFYKELASSAIRTIRIYNKYEKVALIK